MRQLVLPGLWEERPRGLRAQLRVCVLGHSSFQNIAGPRCPLCHFSPLPEKSLKLNGSRGGIFSKCQCNLWYITAKAIILVPGSECQRTGRDRATNSRLAGGTSAPLSWEIILAGEGTGPTLGSVGWDWASVGDTQWAREGPVCFVCSHVSVPVHFFIITVCWWVRAQTLWEGVSEHRLRSVYMCPPSPRVTICLCVHTH